MGKDDDIEQRAREAAHLQLIEGNPFDADDMAMFEMFDREGLSPEQRRAYIIEQSKKRTAAAAKLSAPAAE
ncbi:hypothetical protein [Rhizobium sp.]